MQSEGLRSRYDLILLDVGRGLGAFAMAGLAAADVFLAPLPLQDGALSHLGAGMQALAQAGQTLIGDEQMTARALGQSAPALPWQKLVIVPNGGEISALPGFAAKLGLLAKDMELLPSPQPRLSNNEQGSLYDQD